MLIASCAAAETTVVRGTLFEGQSLTYTFTDDLGQKTEQQYSSNKLWTVSDGVSTNEMDLLWTARLTLTEGASQTLDLAGGLTNRFGNPISFAGVKWLQVNAPESNSGTITMGDEIAHWATFLSGTNDSVVIRPGCGLMMICPGTNTYGVTATTGDLLKFVNDAVAYTNIVDVYLGGISQ